MSVTPTLSMYEEGLAEEHLLVALVELREQLQDRPPLDESGSDAYKQLRRSVDQELDFLAEWVITSRRTVDAARSNAEDIPAVSQGPRQCSERRQQRTAPSQQSPEPQPLSASNQQASFLFPPVTCLYAA